MKASIIWHSPFLMVQLSHPYMITGKAIALTTWTFVGRVMSLLFNTKSRFKSQGFSSKEQVSFNFMDAVTICSDFGAQEKKMCHCFPAEKQLSSYFMDAVTICSDFGAQEEEIYHYFHLFLLCLPYYLDAMILIFLML